MKRYYTLRELLTEFDYEVRGSDIIIYIEDKEG